MHGRDDGRALAALLAEQQRRTRADDLGAIHVVVDDLRLERARRVGQRPNGQPVVGLVYDRHVDAGLLQPPDAAAV